MLTTLPRAGDAEKLIVQMATLAVHEAMGSKVDREAVATLVLPQLWAMSMGPRELSFPQPHQSADLAVLNADQFAKFMGCVVLHDDCGNLVADSTASSRL